MAKGRRQSKGGLWWSDGIASSSGILRWLTSDRQPSEAAANRILRWLQSRVGQQFVELVASSTSGPCTLSVGKVGDLPIALPPLAVQTRIVAEVEWRLSVVAELELVVSANLQRAIRLRQSILQKAFTGELTETGG